MARQDATAFEAAQQKSAVNLWYAPARDAYSKAGFDLSNRGVQEAVFSSSIQHGGVVSRLLPLIKRISSGNISQMTPEEQIKLIYDGRTQYHPNGKSRYASEVQDALRLSK